MTRREREELICSGYQSGQISTSSGHYNTDSSRHNANSRRSSSSPRSIAY